MKKLILFVVDSLHPAVFGRLISSRQAPALEYLSRHGSVFHHVVSAFPTMTPVALSSIATGSLSDQHFVPGFIWYNQETGRIVDYGGTWQSVVKIGPEKVIRNLLHRLNEEHLSPWVTTFYEKLEAYGLKTGNINFFIHRALQHYATRVPLAMSVATGFKMRTGRVRGPKFLALGELIHPPLAGSQWAWPRGLYNRFGFNDIFAGKMAAQLIREKQQPDFLSVYFPDNDKISHRFGPLRTGASLERVDAVIGRVLDAFGSWEKAVEENVFIVMGDHSQSTIGLGGECRIDLSGMLRQFKQLNQTEKAGPNHDIVICPNERAAYVYLLKEKEKILPAVLEILARDVRNTQIAWKDADDRYCVLQGGTKKQMCFKNGGQYHDDFGQQWEIEGDLTVIDAQKTAEGLIVYGRYPNALERLRSALEARPETRIVLSALPGCEYYSEGAPMHPGGGSHGSLEQEDSVVPMIITGLSEPWQNTRITDVYAYILRHFAQQGLAGA